MWIEEAQRATSVSTVVHFGNESKVGCHGVLLYMTLMCSGVDNADGNSSYGDIRY